MSFDSSTATTVDGHTEVLPGQSGNAVWALQPAAAGAIPVPSRGQGHRERRVPLSLVSGLLRVIDCLVVLVASWLAFALHLGDGGASPSSYVLLGLVGSFAVGNALQIVGAYELSAIRDPLSGLSAVLKAVVAIAVMFIVIGFLTQTSVTWSRLWSGLWFVFAIVGLTGARAGLFLLTRRWSKNGALRRNVAIVGAGPEAERLLTHLAIVGDPTVRIIGLFDNRSGRSPTSVAGHPVLGRIDDLQDFTNTVAVDEVIVTIPWTAEDSLVSIFDQLRCLPVDVRLAPAPIGYRLPIRQVSHLAQLPLLNVLDRPLDDWGHVFKWLEDRVLGFLILLLVALPMALIALAIKLDSPGPVLFRQKRYGFNNRLIEVLKFRTMSVDRCDQDGVVSTQFNDPRITRLGAFLRRTSLDELPQLINVLRGDMSLVGPRPHATETRAGDQLLEDLVAEYSVRHKVKPGITGWAQVNGCRGTIDSVEKLRRRVDLDIHYLENWSLAFDLRIIILTAFCLMGKDVY